MMSTKKSKNTKMLSKSRLVTLFTSSRWQDVLQIFDDPSINDNAKRMALMKIPSIHLACQYNAPFEAIQRFVMNIGGKDLVMKRIASDSQYTALHQACHCKESFEVIKLLIDVGGRELVMAKNGSGRTALSIYLSWHHYSGTNQASLQV